MSGADRGRLPGAEGRLLRGYGPLLAMTVAVCAGIVGVCVTVTV